MHVTEVPRDEQPRTRRQGGRSARVRAAVMEATYSLALEKGVGGFSVSDVAERAGVHQTSIYRRWGTLEHLLIEAMRSRVHQASPVPDCGSLEEDLHAFLGGVAAFMRTPEGLLLSRLAVTASENATLIEPRTRYWHQAITDAAAIFDRAVARGEILPHRAPSMIVEMLVAPLWYRALVTGEELDDTFVEEIVRLVLAGLRRPG